MDEKKIQTIVE
jgi:hypothetical protein